MTGRVRWPWSPPGVGSINTSHDADGKEQIAENSFFASGDGQADIGCRGGIVKFKSFKTLEFNSRARWLMGRDDIHKIFEYFRVAFDGIGAGFGRLHDGRRFDLHGVHQNLKYVGDGNHARPEIQADQFRMGPEFRRKGVISIGNKNLTSMPGPPQRGQYLRMSDGEFQHLICGSTVYTKLLLGPADVLPRNALKCKDHRQSENAVEGCHSLWKLGKYRSCCIFFAAGTAWEYTIRISRVGFQEGCIL